MSYRDLDESSNQLAGWLIDQGLRPGDRVAMHWPNSIEAVQIFFGVFKAGLIAVPVNLRLKPPEVAWVLEHSQAAMCFSHPALAPIAGQARLSVSTLRAIVTELPGFASRGSRSMPSVSEHQPAAILYTSGSTARPKGVTHTHRTLREGARLITSAFLDEQDTVLVITPMMYVAGLGCVLLPAIELGIRAVLLPAFEAGNALDAIERFHCTYTFGLPAMMQFVVEEQARKPRDVSSLRTVIAGGDCVPAALQERFASLFPIRLQEGIGMSETYPILVNPRHAILPGSVGIPMNRVEVRLVGAEGKALPDRETGEIVVRSPVNCIGYWNDASATKELLSDGWLHTGDLACRDSDGNFWFKGRKKQIIVRGGSNISPQEVEEVLYQHPAVLEAGVIGVPDQIYGENVVAFVSLRNGAASSEQELREYAQSRLADYKVPEKILFLDEMPKGLTGKVHRRGLVEMLKTTSNRS